MATTLKTVRVGHLIFDHVAYDAGGDVLYLHVGEPRAAADAEETREGHVFRYDEHGRVAGLTIVNALWLLKTKGAITVTVPEPLLRANAADLAEVLGAAG